MVWRDPQSFLALYLKFNNGMLFWVAGFAVAMLLMLLRHQIEVDGGWSAMWRYLRNDWMRRGARGAPIELTVALLSVCLGMVIKYYAIWSWRMVGSLTADFPYVWTVTGDFFKVAGILCAIRLAATKRDFNWPWLVALGTGLLFAGLSVFFDT